MNNTTYICNLIAQADEILVMAQGQARLQHEWVAVTALGSSRDMAQLARKALLTPRPDVNAIEFPRSNQEQPPTTPEHPAAQSEGASQLPRAGADGGTGSFKETL